MEDVPGMIDGRLRRMLFSAGFYSHSGELSPKLDAGDSVGESLLPFIGGPTQLAVIGTRGRRSATMSGSYALHHRMELG
jgi:hypothetical protein